MDWPVEESIPPPSSHEKKKLSEKKMVNHDYLTKPIILPPSPLKSLQNTSEQKNFKSPENEKSTSGEKYTNVLQRKDERQIRDQTHVIRVESRQPENESIFVVKEAIQTIDIAEKRSVIKQVLSSEEMSLDRSITSDGENKAPAGTKQMTKRMERLMRAKRATSPAPSLKHSLYAAKTVMEEEKSTAGSSDASSRSSLSNKELSSIASRALKLAQGNKYDSSVDEELPSGSVRGMRTISKVSHQEARLALLSAARKKNKKTATDVSVNKALQISATESYDSTKGRRLDHPAFANRVSPRPTAKAKVSSVDIMTSFRQFNSIRNNSSTPTGKIVSVLYIIRLL
jgi:hypothetical protein